MANIHKVVGIPVRADKFRVQMDLALANAQPAQINPTDVSLVRPGRGTRILVALVRSVLLGRGPLMECAFNAPEIWG